MHQCSRHDFLSLDSRVYKFCNCNCICICNNSSRHVEFIQCKYLFCISLLPTEIKFLKFPFLCSLLYTPIRISSSAPWYTSSRFSTFFSLICRCFCFSSPTTASCTATPCHITSHVTCHKSHHIRSPTSNQFIFVMILPRTLVLCNNFTEIWLFSHLPNRETSHKIYFHFLKFLDIFTSTSTSVLWCCWLGDRKGTWPVEVLPQQCPTVYLWNKNRQRVCILQVPWQYITDKKNVLLNFTNIRG